MNFNTPTLSSSAVLVSLTIGIWNDSKRDKRKTDELTVQSRARAGVAKVSKTLMPDSDELDAIKKIMGQARKYLYETTMVWAKDKQNLLAMTKYQEFVSVMHDFERDFYDGVNVFIPTYAQKMQEAQGSLGDLYDPDDYPSVHEVRSKFRFVVEFEPVPTAGHFVVDLHEQAKQELIERFNSTVNDKARNSFAAVCEELKETMTHLVSKVDGADDESKSTRMHSTLLPNIRRVIDKVRTANNIMGNNPEVEAVVSGLEASLASVSVEALRDNETVRERVRADVKNALSKFNF